MEHRSHQLKIVQTLRFAPLIFIYQWLYAKFHLKFYLLGLVRILHMKSVERIYRECQNIIGRLLRLKSVRLNQIHICFFVRISLLQYKSRSTSGALLLG